MVIHHVVTMGLIFFSWVVNFVRIGSLILCLHDAVDYWMEVGSRILLFLIMYRLFVLFEGWKNVKVYSKENALWHNLHNFHIALDCDSSNYFSWMVINSIIFFYLIKPYLFISGSFIRQLWRLLKKWPFSLHTTYLIFYL